MYRVYLWMTPRPASVDMSRSLGGAMYMSRHNPLSLSDEVGTPGTNNCNILLQL